jgi:PEP-CTERM motif
MPESFHYFENSRGVLIMQKTKSRFATFVLVCGLMWASNAFGDSITIFNTGESSGGPALASGQTDSHYSLISAPAGVPLTAIATAPNAAWTANTATADWIGTVSGGALSSAVGTYDYQTKFDLTGDNPSTALLSGLWTSDNQGCIFLNGTNTGDCTGETAFGSLQSFSISTGFTSGINTIDFIIDNGGGPTGVIAEVSGTVSSGSVGSAVPEPSTFALVGTSLLGLCGTLRNKLACRNS